MIKAQNLTKTFNNHRVVNDISFEIAEGRTMVFLGTSGCGKTTTLRMLNRLINPTSGSVYINGKNICNQVPEQLRRSIGYVLQHNSLFPHYSVLENIAVVPQLLKWDKRLIRNRAIELMEKLHLSKKLLNAYPRQLSGGEAQRVNIARALVAKPPILLMDEPFSALDTITRLAIRQEFTALDELKDKTIVMVTHDVQEAFEMADIVCLMDKGRIIQQGKPADLLFHPTNDFVRDFLSDSFLQLALTVTHLVAVWPYLTAAVSTHSVQINLSVNATIAKALTAVKDKNNWDAVISITNGTEQKTTSWAGLLQAYAHYKKESL